MIESNSSLSKPRRELLAGASVCLALLALTPFSLELSLSLKLFIDTLTVGISNTKTYLFLAYLGICLTLLSFSTSENIRKTKKLKILGALILLLHTVAVLEQISFTHRLGVPANRILIVYQDYDYAKTSLSHIHVGKAVLGQWFSGANHSFDGGTAFLEFFPRPLLVVHFFLLLGTAMWSLQAIRDEVPGFRGWERSTLVLSLFILMETSIDGGPFSSQTIPATALYLTLVFDRRPLIVGSATLGLLLGMSWLTWPLAAENLLRSFTALASIGLAGSLFSLRSRKLKSASVIALVVVSVLSGHLLNRVSPRVQAVGTAYNTVLYALTSIAPNQAVEVVSLTPLSSDDAFEKLRESRVGPFVLTKLRCLEAGTVLGICRRFSLNIARKPVNESPGPRLLIATRLNEKNAPPTFEPIRYLAPDGANINAAAAVLGAERQILGTLYLQDVSRAEENRLKQ